MVTPAGIILPASAASSKWGSLLTGTLVPDRGGSQCICSSRTGPTTQVQRHGACLAGGHGFQAGRQQKASECLERAMRARCRAEVRHRMRFE